MYQYSANMTNSPPRLALPESHEGVQELRENLDFHFLRYALLAKQGAERRYVALAQRHGYSIETDKFRGDGPTSYELRKTESWPIGFNYDIHSLEFSIYISFDIQPEKGYGPLKSKMQTIDRLIRRLAKRGFRQSGEELANPDSFDFFYRVPAMTPFCTEALESFVVTVDGFYRDCSIELLDKLIRIYETPVRKAARKKEDLKQNL
jgi:hypothetical protein